MFFEEIKIKPGPSYIAFCPLRILYNSKFILMATSLGTNAVVVTRVHCIYLSHMSKDTFCHAYLSFSVDTCVKDTYYHSYVSFLFRVHSCYYVLGEQKIAKINEAGKNTVHIHLGLFRLPQFETSLSPLMIQSMLGKYGMSHRNHSIVEVGNILSWRLIMKYFLRSFFPFR